MKINATPAEFRELLADPIDEQRVVPFEQRSCDGPTIMMTKTAYEDGMRHLGSVIPEMGGMLIGPKGHRSVTHYIPDTSGISRPGSFTWDDAALNAILDQYTSLGLDARGFWHSHPPGHRRLSGGDLDYVRGILDIAGNKVDEIFMPIYVDGECRPFIVYPNLRVVEAKLVLY